MKSNDFRCFFRFLSDKGLSGSGIDTRITVFFNPRNKGIARAVIEDLDKSAVELVCFAKYGVTFMLNL